MIKDKMYIARINFLQNIKCSVCYVKRLSFIQEIATSEQSLNYENDDYTHNRKFLFTFSQYSCTSHCIACVKLEMQYSYAQHLLDSFSYLCGTIHKYLCTFNWSHCEIELIFSY